MKSLQLMLVFVFTLFAVTSVIFAQTETGQIAGTVVDPSGAAVPGAAVSVKSVATGAVRETKTAVGGEYNFTNLLPGEYTVSATAAGFSQIQQRASVAVGAKVNVDIHLEVGKSSTVVEVNAAPVQVNVESQTLSTNITQTQLRELPTLTRNAYSLVALSGNVSDAAVGGRGAGVAINGLRESGTDILLDGSANNDEFTASVGQAVPLDAIQEFSVLTNNFTAEFGRASAGVVNVVTKSGSNEFHGTAYEFNRLSALASNDFQDNSTGTPKSVFTRNQFGYSFGGPIKKNKLFFFSSTELIRIRSVATEYANVPDPAFIAAAAPATQAYFSAYGKLKPSATVLQTFTKADLGCTRPLCAALPASTPAYDLVSYNVPFDAGGGQPENQVLGVDRVDYNLSDKTQMYGRYAIQKVSNFPGTLDNSPYVGYDTGEEIFNNNALFSIIHLFGPTWVSQSKVVVNRLSDLQPFSSTYGPVPTLYTTSSGTGSLGGYPIYYPGYTPAAPGSGIPFGGPQNFAQLYEDVSHVMGKHNIRFGGSFEYLRDNRTFGAYETAGEYLGSNQNRSYDGLLGGTLAGFQVAVNPQGKLPGSTVSLPLGQPNFSRSYRYKESALYVQDAWRVVPRLTLNLGLRWEYYGVQHDKNPALESNFFFPSNEINTPQGFAAGSDQLVGQSPVGGFWAPDYKDFAPRLGFAWDVTGNGKTSLRGGYGIGYERNFGNVTFNAIQNPPNYETISLTSASFGTIPVSVSNLGPFAGSSGSITLPAATLRVPMQNIKTAYAHLFSLSLEHQLSPHMLVAADYSGSMGERLYDVSVNNRNGYGNVYLNEPCSFADTQTAYEVTGSFGPTTCVNRLNPQYGGINTRGGLGFSRYNALNLRTVIDNLGQSGLHLTLNYTWSHTIDDQSTSFSDADCLNANWGCFNTGYLDPFNPALDTGNADYDIRHRVVVSAVWDVPAFKTGHGIAHQVLGGWSLTPIVTIRTGTPYTIFDGSFVYTQYIMASFNAPVSTAANKNPAPYTGAGSAPNEFVYFGLPSSLVSSPNPTYFLSDLPPYPSNMTSRNAFRGPGFWDVDMGVHKTFNLTERIGLQIRGEFFNLFNHANLYVEGSTADVEFGTPILACKGCSGGSQDRRNVQLAAKIIF